MLTYLRIPRQIDDLRMALIVPYRESPHPTSHGQDRGIHLSCFVHYMKSFLSRIGREFHLFVIEQTDGALFNKGALFNAGCIIALSEKSDYMVLHDIDQFPESPANTYEFPGFPTHLCTASSQFGYRLPYKEMVGGVFAISLRDYHRVNGYSNNYWGWGQEDDDFYFRLVRVFGKEGIQRLKRKVGRYRALDHPRIAGLDESLVFNQNKELLKKMETGKADFSTDGISSVKYELVDVDRKPEFTRYLVQLRFDRMPCTLGE